MSRPLAKRNRAFLEALKDGPQAAVSWGAASIAGWRGFRQDTAAILQAKGLVTRRRTRGGFSSEYTYALTDKGRQALETGVMP